MFFFLNSKRFGVWVTYMNATCNGTNFCQFQSFSNQTLCIFWQMKNIYNISDAIFIRPPGSCPGVGLVGTGGGGRSKKCFSKIQPDLVCMLLT